MTTSNPKVLLFSTEKQSFIEDDVRLLEEFSDVKWICAHGLFTAVHIKWSMLFSDVGIAWFASVYSAILSSLHGFWVRHPSLLWAVPTSLLIHISDMVFFCHPGSGLSSGMP